MKDERRQLFCEEYLIDLNETQAAIRAGYSPKSARKQGSRLYADADIRACIDKELAKRSKRTGVNQDRVIRELARIAFVKATDVIDLDEAAVNKLASDDDLAVIASVRVKKIPTPDGMGVEREVKLADKLKALELLGRHLGMFTDNVHLSGDMGVQIINDIPKDTG